MAATRTLRTARAAGFAAMRRPAMPARGQTRQPEARQTETTPARRSGAPERRAGRASVEPSMLQVAMLRALS